MKQNCHSITAYKVALMRAVHQILDNPRVFEDPIALKIIGVQGNSEIHSKKRKFETRLHSYLRAGVVARSRFVEDELSEAIKRDIRQYIILGAGLDTFAYRNPYTSIDLKIFEVDHPASQEWKRQQLYLTKIPIPKNLSFVPTNFENQSLAKQLLEAGLRTDKPSFISWMGVTMYLPYETVIKMVKHISSFLSSGSGMVFDYVVPPSTQNFLRRLVFRLLARRLSRLEEPWVCFLDTASLVAELKAIGFTQAVDIGPEEINTRFFNDRTDQLKVGTFVHWMKVQS